MNPYQPPLADFRFLLETFGYPERVASLPAFQDFDLETAMDLVQGYADYCVGTLLPLNARGDAQGVRYLPEQHAVKTPDGFIEAWRGWCENGFVGLAHKAEHGGLGAPFSLSILASEVLIACNKSFSMCPGLTGGLVEALEAHASDELKERYLHKLVSGEWAGTMCLTEPHCGTDLGLLTTRAEPEGDHYRLHGTKIWITFGEHDLTENIVHLVLARLPGAPPGTRGISTFLVPKVLPDGSRNAIFCGGTDHKMGIHASPTCVMNLEGATGWLVGEENRGMVAMFTMMNSARLNVGIEGVALGEAAYQAARAFARDRRQSRALNPARQEPGQAADNILVHPDVRRMLLLVRSTTEGLRGLVAWISVLYDVMHHAEREEERQAAGDMVALLTPIIKAYGSERGFLNISESMQVMGGAGFTRDWPVEQFLRDERIAMIYEGTNHIQALDLVGRKLPMGGGRLVKAFAGEIQALLARRAEDPRMAEIVAGLGAEAKRLSETTRALSEAAARDAEVIGAVANAYLGQFALVTMAYVWARQVEAVLDRPEEDELRRSKLQLARFFYAWVLPEAALHARRVAAGKDAITEIDTGLL